jgi:hypothetical protein
MTGSRFAAEVLRLKAIAHTLSSADGGQAGWYFQRAEDVEARGFVPARPSHDCECHNCSTFYVGRNDSGRERELRADAAEYKGF